MVSVVAVLGMSGCGSECTEQELQEKMQEMTVKIKDLAASGDMSKMLEFSTKAQKISASMQGEDNIQAACEAVDDLMAEL